jgi:predicted phosphate transport protein (TIGR00153 family)
VRFRLIPREENFYTDFEAMTEETHRGAILLEEMLAPDPPVWDKADEIKEIEHRCDTLAHQIIQRLHSTFVTPIDREDIHALARSLDDVMDAIDDAAAVVRLYQIDRMRFGARELARMIRDATAKTHEAMRAPEKRLHVEACAVEINRLENEADRLHQQALQQLFADEKDPIAIIKWKEIFDFLEAATDRAEDVANVLEGVVIKHS